MSPHLGKCGSGLAALSHTRLWRMPLTDAGSATPFKISIPIADGTGTADPLRRSEPMSQAATSMQ
jgi:hypothetical protein